jgi:hypothetical protein
MVQKFSTYLTDHLIRTLTGTGKQNAKFFRATLLSVITTPLFTLEFIPAYMNSSLALHNRFFTIGIFYNQTILQLL